jgi:methylmalonyl-CoA/ethylmalonyl-CoA epimerase
MHSTLHHIGVATRNAMLDADDWQQALGLTRTTDLVHDPVQKVRVLFLSDGRTDGTLVELVEPAADDSPVGIFLKARSRFYHVCYEVDDLQDALRHVRAHGALVVRPPESAVAYAGRRIAWCCSRSGNLIELLERR